MFNEQTKLQIESKQKPIKVIEDYIDNFIEYPNPYLAELDERYRSIVKVQPNVTKQGGNFLYQLIVMKSVKRVLEIGLCLGYSTIWIAEALKFTHGKVTSLEIDSRFIEPAQANIDKAGVSEFVEIINVDAAEYVKSNKDKYDLIIIDANKPLYMEIIDDVIDQLNTGGIIYADDTLFRPLGYKERLSRPMDIYNSYVMQHPLLISTILSIGDGVTMSILKPS